MDNNPTNSSFSLWEHVHPQNYSGSFVSTTEEASSTRILKLVSDTSFYARAPQIFAHLPIEPITLYEYRLRDIVGMKTPDGFGVDTENEVVTHRILDSQIEAYRELEVNKWTGTVLRETRWLPMANVRCQKLVKP